MKKAPNSPKSFEINIEKLVYGGMGLGRHQGKVIFVPYSVPGDRLRVRAVEEKKKFIRAEISQIIQPGLGRVAPICPLFGKCGGCHWQQMEYPRQVEAKRQILEEVFHHRFPQTRELPITVRPCPQPFSYRSRARIQLRGPGSKSSVGFFRHRSHTVEDVKSCPLFRPSLNEALSALRQFKIKVGTSPETHEMDIASSEEDDTWASARIGPDINEGVSALVGTGRNEEVVMQKRVGEFLYSVTASVFFQANDFMVPELAALVRELAKTAGHDSALDLYSGVGLFSLSLARQFKKVVAVDNSPTACRFCSINASNAGLTNIQPVCADVPAWIEASKFAARPGLDLIVLDPPRTGAGVKVTERICELSPQTIIYASCDPQTLVRDIARLPERNFSINHIEGLDLFPQTFHFETVVRLIRK